MIKSTLQEMQPFFLDELEKIGYKLRGHTNFQGLRIAVENRKGDVRRGADSDGKKWETRMRMPYGYLVSTKGADGEPVDTYVGPGKEAPDAYVVHQRDKETGKYDEDKVMLGFRSKKEAKEAFLAHYDSPKFLGPIKRVDVERLRELVASKKRLVKIAEDKERSKRLRQFIRKAGPGIGGVLGLAVGAVSGSRKGQLLRRAVTGFGTGASLGWAPDVVLSAREATKKLKKSLPARR
jgi:hypothetical protein